VTQPDREKPTILSLQAGRGLAALAVVLMHSAMAGRDFGGGPFIGDTVLQYGRFGVDFFFVLSGFIIYHSTVGRDRSLSEYAIARFRRIYLPYWPVGIAVALLYIALPNVSGSDRGWSWLPTLTLAPVDAMPALAVAWTLQHEILFYLLFGLFYYSRLLPFGLGAWALCIVVGGDHLPFRAVNLEFFFGIAAAMIYRSKRAHPSIALAAPLFIACWILEGADDHHRVLVGAAFACVVAALAEVERRGLRVPAALVSLGAASYSLYLVHLPIISAVARLSSGSWTILASAVCASLVGGFAYHFAVEQRVIRKRTNPEVFAGAVARDTQVMRERLDQPL
jgi:peptidoglycan/LPS O-acetylase OafA/YrhL